jgi:hypothetical protein
MGVTKLEALSAIYVAAPPMMRSLFPKGVSMASKAMVPTTSTDIDSNLVAKVMNKISELTLAKPLS